MSTDIPSAAQSASAPFVLSHDLHIARPEPEVAVVVPLSQWDKLRTRIEKCSEPLDLHMGIGWAAIGVAATCALSAVTLYASVDFVRIVDGQQVPNITAMCAIIGCLALTIAASGIAWAALYYAGRAAKTSSQLKSLILEDMQTLRDLYQRHVSQN